LLGCDFAGRFLAPLVASPWITAAPPGLAARASRAAVNSPGDGDTPARAFSDQAAGGAARSSVCE